MNPTLTESGGKKTGRSGLSTMPVLAAWKSPMRNEPAGRQRDYRKQMAVGSKGGSGIPSLYSISSIKQRATFLEL